MEVYFDQSLRTLVSPMVTALLLLTGCSESGLTIFQRDEIRAYQVKRPAPPHRMLGAIVPQGEKAWFFKMSGARDSIEGQAPAFDAFIKSLQLGESADDDPAWELPDGWKQEPGEGMRFATIHIDTDEAPLEMSIMALPLPPENGVLTNVNRWRGQLGVGPIVASKLAVETTQIEVAGTTATIVNLLGKLGAAAPGPSSSGGGNLGSDERMKQAHAAAGVEPKKEGMQYEAPDNWKPGQLISSGGGLSIPREAAFVVEENGKSAEITVTRMPAAAGDITSNANRWRAQVGLDRLTSAKLQEETNVTAVDGVESEYFRFIGPEKAILGVITIHEGAAYFIKLHGDHDLAVKLQEPFEAFLQSIQF